MRDVKLLAQSIADSSLISELCSVTLRSLRLHALCALIIRTQVNAELAAQQSRNQFDPIH